MDVGKIWLIFEHRGTVTQRFFSFNLSFRRNLVREYYKNLEMNECIIEHRGTMTRRSQEFCGNTQRPYSGTQKNKTHTSNINTLIHQHPNTKTLTQ